MARLDAGLTLSIAAGSLGCVPCRLRDPAERNGVRCSRVQEDDRAYTAAPRGAGEKTPQGGQVMRTRTSAASLAKQMGISKGRALEAVVKARLIAAVVREASRRRLTHVELAGRSGLPRSAVTGILSGSL